MVLEQMSALRRRVVITGSGAITPLGLNVEDTWAAMLGGRSGIGPAESFDTTDLDSRIAGERFWVWDDGELVSMTAASAPVAGVARVQYVFTPRDRRGSGYATACVEAMSRVLTARGHVVGKGPASC